jgi:hypothetical protein
MPHHREFRPEGVRRVEESADVLAVGDKSYVCADYSESLAFTTRMGA